MIPDSREGWAVDVAGGIAHRRYAPHARGLPRCRTAAELRTYLGDEPKACGECWPAAPAGKPKRTGGTPKLAEVRAPRRVIDVVIAPPTEAATEAPGEARADEAAASGIDTPAADAQTGSEA